MRIDDVVADAERRLRGANVDARRPPTLTDLATYLRCFTDPSLATYLARLADHGDWRESVERSSVDVAREVAVGVRLVMQLHGFQNAPMIIGVGYLTEDDRRRAHTPIAEWAQFCDWASAEIWVYEEMRDDPPLPTLDDVYALLTYLDGGSPP